MIKRTQHGPLSSETVCSQNQITQGRRIVYVAGAETLKGYSNPRGMFIGTWYTRSNIKEILIQLQVSMSDGSKIHPIEKAWKYVNSEGPMNI